MSQRTGFYILFDSFIEATARANGVFSQELYLEGQQLIDKAKYIGGVEDEQVLSLLKSCAGFRQLVHSIGITVHSDHDSSIIFTLENWGKRSKYESGSRVSIECATDGSETLLQLDELQWSEDDDVLGKIAFQFQEAGMLATASVIFYVHDGYEIQELIADEPVQYHSSGYQQMITNSLLSMGNNRRLKAAIQKAKRGEDVTIAYIGGSITQGAGAKPIHTMCYANQSYEAFKELFGQQGTDHIHLIKAGVGGTPSELGMIRYERDVLRNGNVQPDIVVIEFAVNDADDETEGNCYESLVLKALNADNKPAVILLFSVFIDDWNLQDRLSPVGTHYELPMVSVKDAVSPQFPLTKADGNIVTKRQYFYDIYHPTNTGHKIMADSLAWLFAEVDRAELSPHDIDLNKLPAIGNDFVHVRLLDRATDTHLAVITEGGFNAIDTDLQCVEMDDQPQATPQFPHNWMHGSDSDSTSFVLSITCKKLVLLYKDSGSTAFGSVDIIIDGQPAATADARAVQWTHCHATILFNEQHASEHRIEIKMSEGQEQQCFTILGFGYVA